jgi:transposase-like protein
VRAVRFGGRRRLRLLGVLNDPLDDLLNLVGADHFLEPRRRAEQALVAVVQEAYVNGVSTRRVDRLVEQLGVTGLSKDQVSRLCRGLDEQVRVFRERPLAACVTRRW